ncbi:tRNA-dihydrouridine synthase, partial [mine drainage metagenome]
GVMIGRASFGQPWLFRAIDSFLETRADERLARAELRDIILAHLDSLYGFYGEETGVRIARKHIGWYCERCLPDPQPVRAELMSARSTALQLAGVRRHFDAWVGPDGGKAAPGNPARIECRAGIARQDARSGGFAGHDTGAVRAA